METQEMNANRLTQFMHDSIMFIGIVSIILFVLVCMGYYQFNWQRAGSEHVMQVNADDVDRAISDAVDHDYGLNKKGNRK